MKLITTMTLKELEKEHTKEAQILLNMLSCNKYTKQDIEKQKMVVDTIYKMISKKHTRINKIKG